MFHIESIKTPTHGNSSVSTKIINLPAYIALGGQGGQQFIELSASGIVKCLQKRPAQCLRNLPIESSRNPSGAWAVFRQMIEQIQELCQLEVGTWSVEPAIREITPGTLLLNNIQEITWDCARDNGNAYTVTGCDRGFCVLPMPCGCSARFKDIVVPESFSQCTESPTAATIVNLNILSRIWSKDIIDSFIVGSFIEEETIRDTEEIFRTLEAKMKAEFRQTDALNFEIDKAIASAKATRDPSLTMDQVWDFEVGNNWLACLSLILSIFAAALSLWILIRSRTVGWLAVATSNLQNIPQVQATDVSRSGIKFDACIIIIVIGVTLIIAPIIY